MRFKDLLTKETYGSLLDKSIRPRLAKTTVPRTTKDIALQKPNILPPAWEKVCSNEMWATTLNYDISGNLSSMSLDPLLRRFYAKKEEVMTEVLGWLTSQAPDSIRPALLAALQIKRLKELIEFAKCMTNIVNKISATIRNNIIGMIKAQQTLMVYLNKLSATAKILETEFLNIPNIFVATILTGVMVNFKMYLNDVLSAIASSDVGAAIGAVTRLALAANNLKNTLANAKAFAVNFPGAAFAQMQNFINNNKTLIDGSMISIAQNNFRANYGWLLGTPEGTEVFHQVVSATTIDWVRSLAIADAYASHQILMAKAQPINNEVRNQVKYDLYRATPQEMMTYTSSFASYASPAELKAWADFVEAPLMTKSEVAQSLIKTIDQVSAQNDADIKDYNDKIAALDSIISTCEAYLKTQELISSVQKDNDDIDAKIKIMQADADRYSNLNLLSGVQDLINASPGAFSMTMTNDGSMFETFDSVTTHDLLTSLSGWSVNQWYSLHSNDARGTLTATSSNMLSLKVAHSAFILDPTRSMGLRMIVNNGMWILECYNDGNPLINEDIGLVDDGTSITYGRFTSVPTTPNPNTVVLMTYDEWHVANNHPSPVSVLDIDFEIVAPPSHCDNNEIVYHAGNLVTGRQWERYLTQAEIDYQEANYLEALRAFKLSPISTTVVNGGRTYSMCKDHQIKDLLLHKKPYTNMSIPIYSVSLQIAKIVPDKVVINPDGSQNTIIQTMELIPPDAFSFALNASWGFVSNVL